MHPTAVTLVAMKKVASASDVMTVFHFPAIWDFIVWVTAESQRRVRLEESVRNAVSVFRVMKRAALRALVEFQIVEQVIDDLAVVKADFRELPSVHLDDLMNVADAAGIRIVNCRVVRVVGSRTRRRFDAAQRRLVPVHAGEVRRASLRSIAA